MTTETKFMPGPWEAVRDPSHYYSLSTVVASDRCVAEATGRTLDEVEANARLIAAAPDMYATLQMFREFAQSGSGFCYPAGSLSALDAAIAKANGANP